MTADDLLKTLHTTPTDLTTPLLTVYDLDLDQTPPRAILEANLPYSYTRGFNMSRRGGSDEGSTWLQGLVGVRFERQHHPNTTDMRSDYAIKLEAAQQVERLAARFLSRIRQVTELAPNYPLYTGLTEAGETNALTLGGRVFKELTFNFSIWR